MIDVNVYIKVDFDEEGKKKIEDAFLTIRKIIRNLEKAGDSTFQMRDELQRANEYLQAILDGVTW